jgi:DNA-binding transcriptional LysR family regulator
METGTVTSAASQLGISQPGISNLLSQLETQTKFRLFDRAKGRLTPTREAEILFREVDTVVRGVDHVSQTVIDLQNKQSGQLQVASTHFLSFGFMPNLIARFCSDRPGLSVSFQSQYSSKIQEWVVSGLFEVGICEMPILYDGFDHIKLRYEMLCTMPEGHPLQSHDVITPKELADQPLVVMGPAHMTHRRMREAFDQSGIAFRPQIHTHLCENMLSFVKVGLGVALIDPFTVTKPGESGFVTRRFDPPVHLDMAVISSKSRPLSRVGTEFMELVLTELALLAVD